MFWYSPGQILPCGSMAIAKIQSVHIHLNICTIYIIVFIDIILNLGPTYFVRVIFSGFLYILWPTITDPEECAYLRLKEFVNMAKCLLLLLVILDFGTANLSLSRHVILKMLSSTSPEILRF